MADSALADLSVVRGRRGRLDPTCPGEGAVKPAALGGLEAVVLEGGV